jgi:hypothetical protein
VRKWNNPAELVSPALIRLCISFRGVKCRKFGEKEGNRSSNDQSPLSSKDFGMHIA